MMIFSVMLLIVEPVLEHVRNYYLHKRLSWFFKSIEVFSLAAVLSPNVKTGHGKSGHLAYFRVLDEEEPFKE